MKNKNLRRIIAAAMIIIVAFDHPLNVYAATTVNEVPVNLTCAYGTTTQSTQLGDFIFDSSIIFAQSKSSDSAYDYKNATYEVIVPVVFKRLNSDKFTTGYYNSLIYRNIDIFVSLSVYSGSTFQLSSIYCDDSRLDIALASVYSDGKRDYSNKAPFLKYFRPGDFDVPPSYTDLEIYYKFNNVYFNEGSNVSDVFNLHFVYEAFNTIVDNPLFYIHFDDKPFTLTQDMFISNSDISSDVAAIKDELQNERNEDREDADKAGDDSKSFVEDALDLENKWEILWFPIKFTNQILQVFTGGTSAAAYQEYYGSIVGYTYNDDTGYVEPVIDKTRSVARAGGTVITFPEFTLPVLDVKLWDSYDFDLSTIKDSFPLVFDSIYVAGSILEVYWFVGFLRDKYEEVFG